MALQLSNILNPTARSRETLLVIQHNLATSWLPIAQTILTNSPGGVIVCLCLLHPAADVLPKHLLENDAKRIRIIDWTAMVPEYGGDKEASRERLVSEVQRVLDDGEHWV
jgi:hypothetical protein